MHVQHPFAIGLLLWTNVDNFHLAWIKMHATHYPGIPKEKGAAGKKDLSRIWLRHETVV